MKHNKYSRQEIVLSDEQKILVKIGVMRKDIGELEMFLSQLESEMQSMQKLLVHKKRLEIDPNSNSELGKRLPTRIENSEKVISFTKTAISELCSKMDRLKDVEQ